MKEPQVINFFDYYPGRQTALPRLRRKKMEEPATIIDLVSLRTRKKQVLTAQQPFWLY